MDIHRHPGQTRRPPGPDDDGKLQRCPPRVTKNYVQSAFWLQTIAVPRPRLLIGLWNVARFAIGPRVPGDLAHGLTSWCSGACCASADAPIPGAGILGYVARVVCGPVDNVSDTDRNRTRGSALPRDPPASASPAGTYPPWSDRSAPAAAPAVTDRKHPVRHSACLPSQACPQGIWCNVSHEARRPARPNRVQAAGPGRGRNTGVIGFHNGNRGASVSAASRGWVPSGVAVSALDEVATPPRCAGVRLITAAPVIATPHRTPRDGRPGGDRRALAAARLRSGKASLAHARHHRRYRCQVGRHHSEQRDAMSLYAAAVSIPQSNAAARRSKPSARSAR